jgi:aspartate aminotransferase
MSLSQLASSIAESPTLRLNEEAAKLRERGEAVIHLGIGEPKNKTPINAIISSASRLNSGEVKYTPSDGIPSLKKAIIRYTEENYDKLVGAQNVIVTSGAKQAIYNVLYTILNPQDEVIIPVPYWVSYPEMVKMVYGVPVFVKPEDGGLYPHMSEIEEAVGPYTRAMIINSPNNPSGVIYPPEFVSAVVDFCERKNIWLIMDDIYHKLVFDGKTAPSCFSYTTQDIESTKIIVINGVSKIYGMTGFRIGWAVANSKIVQIMNNVQGNVTSGPSVVLQAAAEGALTGLQGLVESLRLTIQNNRDVMMDELSAFDGVKATKPEGTFYVFPDFAAFSHDSVKLSEFLLKKALVVTVPGKEFGMEGHLRLSYSGTVKDVTEGVARIRWALDPNSPADIYIGDRKVVRDWL